MASVVCATSAGSPAAACSTSRPSSSAASSSAASRCSSRSRSGSAPPIYLSEYARPRSPDAVSPSSSCSRASRASCSATSRSASSTPNLVVRFFRRRTRRSRFSPPDWRRVLTIPFIASVAEDALRAVPMALREASFGLGAQRSQTAVQGGLSRRRSPASSPPCILGSRGGRRDDGRRHRRGRGGRRPVQLDPLDPGQTMTAAMAALGFGSDQVAGNDLAFQSLYFLGFCCSS